MPAWPDLGVPPDFQDCDGEGPGTTICVSVQDLSRLGAVLVTIARWRDAVLACPEGTLVVNPTTSRFHFPGLAGAVDRAAHSLGDLP